MVLNLNRHKHLIAIVISILVVFISNVVKSQTDLQISSGSSANFSITTLSQYTEVNTVGKTLSYSTNIRTTIENLTEPDWRLEVYASEIDIPYFGSPPNSLSLNNLTLAVTSTPGYSYIIPTAFSPTASPGTVILSGSGDGSGTPVVLTLTITYTLTGNMSVKPEGLYYVELNFGVRTKPTLAAWPW